MSRLKFAAGLLLLGGVLSAAAPAPKESVAYYYGDVLILSPDGGARIGKTVSLVKRSIEPDAGRIVETVLQPPRNPKDAAKDIVTTMRRIGETGEFAAEDEGRTFSGTLTFAGADWVFNRWTYAIEMKDGSRLAGEGTLDEQGIKTDKLFSDPQGAARFRLKEDLRAISADEYLARRREILGS